MSEDILELISVVRGAGKIVMAYRRDGFSVSTKRDPLDFVTEADHASEAAIVSAIRERFPDDAILAEETPDRPADYHGRVWMIDPLDGTRSFVEGADGFSVMVGLAVDGVPTIGIVYDPCADVTYVAERGAGAFRIHGTDEPEPIRVSRTPAVDGMTVSARVIKDKPRPDDRFTASLRAGNTITAGSVGLRILYVADGSADASVCLNPHTMKWDFCASQVILEEAGGRMTGSDGTSVGYLIPDGEFSGRVLASNGILHDELLSRLRDFLTADTDTHSL